LEIAQSGKFINIVDDAIGCCLDFVVVVVEIVEFTFDERDG